MAQYPLQFFKPQLSVFHRPIRVLESGKIFGALINLCSLISGFSPHLGFYASYTLGKRE